MAVLPPIGKNVILFDPIMALFALKTCDCGSPQQQQRTVVLSPSYGSVLPVEAVPHTLWVRTVAGINRTPAEPSILTVAAFGNANRTDADASLSADSEAAAACDQHECAEQYGQRHLHSKSQTNSFIFFMFDSFMFY
jgi:hypothetical protein